MRTVHYRLLAISGLLVFTVLGVSEAWAQEDPCTSAIAEARTQYQNGHFDQAIQRLYECLIGERVGGEKVVEGHRLLALSYLRKDDLQNARLTIVRLLGKAPGYTPDPVQNPPSYVSLVQNVKKQLEVQGEPTVAQAEEQEGWGRPDVLVAGSMGFTHYGGERGYAAENPVSELTKGAGLAMQLSATYQFSTHFGAGLSYSAGAFPELIIEKNAPEFKTIDEATSSTWVHGLSLFGRGRLFLQAFAAPYVRAGVTGAFTKKNDIIRAGFGPQGAIGVDIPLGGRIGIRTEWTGSLIFPGESLDLVDQGSGYDSVFSVVAGLRYRFGNR